MGNLAYLWGYFIKNSHFNQFKKHIVERSFLLMAIVLLIASLLPTKGSEIYTNLQQALFTFASVFFGFWLSDARKKEELTLQKQKELDIVRIYFFLMWEELRLNLSHLEYMKLNLQTGFSIKHPGLITISLNKLDTFEKMTNHFKDSIYQSYISSKSFVNLTSELLSSTEQRDKLITLLDNTYTEFQLLRSFLAQTTNGIRTNLLSSSLVKQYSPNTRIDDTLLNEEIKLKIADAVEQILISYRTFQQCIRTLEEFAPNLNIKFENNIQRISYLTEEDKKIISNLFKPPPEEALKDPFNYMRKKEETR